MIIFKYYKISSKFLEIFNKINIMANQVDLAHLQAIADAMAGETNQAVRYVAVINAFIETTYFSMQALFVVKL